MLYFFHLARAGATTVSPRGESRLEITARVPAFTDSGSARKRTEMDFLPALSGDALGLLPDKIQERKNIDSFEEWQLLSSGATDGGGQQVDSDGNHVIVRSLSDGVNVNNNWDDNRNSDIGLASARQSIPIF